MGRFRFTPLRPCCTCCPPGIAPGICCPCDCQGYCYTPDGQDAVYLPFVGNCTWQGSGWTIQYCYCSKKWKVWSPGNNTPAVYDFVDCNTAPGGAWSCPSGNACADLIAPYNAGEASISVQMGGWGFGTSDGSGGWVWTDKSSDGCVDCSGFNRTFGAAYQDPLRTSHDTCDPVYLNEAGYQFGVCLPTSASSYGGPCGPPYGYYSLGVGVTCSATFPDGPCGPPSITVTITLSDITPGGPNLISCTFEIGNAASLAGTYVFTGEFGMLAGPCTLGTSGFHGMSPPTIIVTLG